ncbi:EAL and HDOD domain-containing protein [Calidifontibacillus oryziterrae]|uniref:EAL and HDOD domain-containing protein n=1 Tax=Calidifontibacillus oryziterrae TaxID=1191699 RepID=UPI0002E0224D|nr:HDOD domain-containing protein [Calidifontibacillus oryziterrae]
MEVYVAKQPIFDNKESIIAYELLYRSSKDNFYNGTDGDKATSEVIVNSFLNIGIKDLSDGKPCFVNFTENLLKLKLPTYFSPLNLVIEILENVPITKELIEICKELKALGYKIALDDFFLMHGNDLTLELLRIVDIVKIDFLATSRGARLDLKKYLQAYDLIFLGEKIETREDYEKAIEDDYAYFQGYFFSKPIILQSHDIPFYFQSYFGVLEELESPEPDLDHITTVIERDISLSYKLLKLINSPAIRPKYEISSIKQAIVLLGLIEIKKWIYVLAIRGLQNEKPDPTLSELIQLSLSRAKFGELLGEIEDNHQYKSKYFLLGLLSYMDSFLHLPMATILEGLPITQDIRAALLGEENHLKHVLDLMVVAERFKKYSNALARYPYKLSDAELFDLYVKANSWASEFIMQLNEGIRE